MWERANRADAAGEKCTNGSVYCANGCGANGTGGSGSCVGESKVLEAGWVKGRERVASWR